MSEHQDGDGRGADGLIQGFRVLEGRAGEDERGVVREFYRNSAFQAEARTQLVWRQINVTTSLPGSIRGLHGEPMTKLIGLASGDALGVYCDARRDSRSFGQVLTVRLVPGVTILVPKGVCNGFQAIGKGPVIYVYAFDAEWEPGRAGTALNPLDPELGVTWPIPANSDDRQKLSIKDASLPTFAQLFGSSPRPAVAISRDIVDS